VRDCCLEPLREMIEFLLEVNLRYIPVIGRTGKMVETGSV
jgi:hypothetical protein